jgi:hypothetical protein
MGKFNKRKTQRRIRRWGGAVAETEQIDEATVAEAKAMVAEALREEDYAKSLLKVVEKVEKGGDEKERRIKGKDQIFAKEKAGQYSSAAVEFARTAEYAHAAQEDGENMYSGIPLDNKQKDDAVAIAKQNQEESKKKKEEAMEAIRMLGPEDANSILKAAEIAAAAGVGGRGKSRKNKKNLRKRRTQKVQKRKTQKGKKRRR